MIFRFFKWFIVGILETLFFSIVDKFIMQKLGVSF